MNKLGINKLVLIGVGLIGGSLALDLKRAGRVAEVVGIDIDADNLARALERKVIDSAHTGIHAEALAAADVVLIATPVGTLPAICQSLAPLLPAHTIVSDVGSTKQLALQAFAQYLPQHYPQCVAAHPIAGSDRHGALAAQFGLFEGKKCILCPHEAQDSGSLNSVSALWQAAGADLYTLSAAEHDAIFAAVSHLPHLTAFALMHSILHQDAASDTLALGGSGFRDFTRIAAGDPAMWRDILLCNREEILLQTDLLIDALHTFARAMEANNGEQLHALIAQASDARSRWQMTTKDDNARL